MKTLLVAALVGLLCGPVMGKAAGSKTVTVAGLKLIPTPFDKEGNFAKLEKYTREAAAAGANIVVGSECYLDGYIGDPKKYPGMTLEKLRGIAETIDDGPYVNRAAALAKELHIYLLFGFSELRGDKVYNTAVLLSPQGGKIGRYSKSHVGRELYEPGDEFPVFDTPLGRLGVLICFDRQLPETSRMLAAKGAQLILIPANSRTVEPINEDIMMRVRAYENDVYVALVGPFNTVMVNRDGDIVAHNSTQRDEGLVYLHADLSGGPSDRGTVTRRRPEIYSELVRPRS